MPVIFTEPIKKLYFASFFSASFIVSLFMLVIAIVVTYLINVLSGQFFISLSNTSVIPNMSFYNQIFLSVTDDLGKISYYSSVIKYNDFYPNLLNVPMIRVSKSDNNQDGILDSFDINIIFPSKPKSIRRISIGFIYSYLFKYSSYNYNFDSIGTIDLSSSNGISYAKCVGEIKFIQKKPISSASVSVLGNIDQVITNSTSPLYINDLVNSFQANDFTSEYRYKAYTLPFKSNSETEINISLNIPSSERILIEAPYLYSLKLAWIQFISIFIPVLIGVYSLTYFLFKLNILEANKKINK